MLARTATATRTDLPQDFDAKRDSYYDDLGQPRDADAFIAQLQEGMKSARAAA